MRKLMLLAAMLAMALAVAAPAFAQDAPLVDQSEDDAGASTTSNTAVLECIQILQQVGGDQYGDAVVSTGEGDAASADNQEFSAEQIQQCQVIVGEYNTGVQNTGDVVTAPPSDNGGGGDDGSNGGGGSGSGGGGSGNGGGSGGGSGGGGGISVLPDTGGVPLGALLAGGALVSFGLLARRLTR